MASRLPVDIHSQLMGPVVHFDRRDTPVVAPAERKSHAVALVHTWTVLAVEDTFAERKDSAAVLEPSFGR